MLEQQQKQLEAQREAQRQEHLMKQQVLHALAPKIVFVRDPISIHVPYRFLGRVRCGSGSSRCWHRGRLRMRSRIGAAHRSSAWRVSGVLAHAFYVLRLRRADSCACAGALGLLLERPGSLCWLPCMLLLLPSHSPRLPLWPATALQGSCELFPQSAVLRILSPSPPSRCPSPAARWQRRGRSST